MERRAHEAGTQVVRCHEEIKNLKTLQNKSCQTELNHTREALDNEKMAMERLETKRRDLEDSITVMSMEKEILDEGCKSLENKTGSLKR